MAQTSFFRSVARQTLVIATFALCCCPVTAMAHPGHGADAGASAATNPVHYLTEPIHAVPIAAVVLFFVARWYRLERQNRVTAKQPV